MSTFYFFLLNACLNVFSFHMLHRTGTRRKHNTRSLVSLSSHSRNKQDIEETKVYKKPKLETKQPSRGMVRTYPELFIYF